MILLAIPAGLAAGFLAWFAAGGVSAGVARLEPLEARLAGLRPSRAAAPGRGFVNLAQLAATPIFALTTGPGAVPLPVLRLEGVSRSKGRAAALLSINDRPAEWLNVGDSRDGVSLQAVTGAKAVVDTLFGPQEVILGEQTASAASPAGSPAAPAAPPPAIVDHIPPGFRSPPPPASAPGLR